MRTLGSIVLVAALAAGTAADAQCGGDCNGDARVVVSELTLGVRMVLEGPDGFACAPRFDADANGFVTVGEVIAAVQHAVVTCPQCPPLTGDYDVPCLLDVMARCAEGADLPLAGVALDSNGEDVRVELLSLQPPLRFAGRARNGLEAELSSFTVGSDAPVPADAFLELSPVYTAGRQTYRLFLRSPTLTIDRCNVEQFFGAFGVGEGNPEEDRPE
jgi:hypothetical protein